jgi:hypothetical protein
VRANKQSYEGSSNCRFVTCLACIINADYELVAALRFRIWAAVSLVVYVPGWGIRGWHLPGTYDNAIHAIKEITA